jgi:hypothetical protein
MATKTSPFKRAIKAAKQAMAGQRYGAHDKPFLCPFCGYDEFKPGPYVTLLMMHTLACAECGHVEFFAKMAKDNRNMTPGYASYSPQHAPRVIELSSEGDRVSF